MTSQFHLDLSYHFKGMKNRSASIKKVVEDSKERGMTYSEDMAGDMFNALYQNNPQIATANNSQYSQALRAALDSARFQHIRMQTQNSLHWSAVGASLITAKLAEELAWTEEEKPPQPKPPKKPPQEEEEKEPQSGGEEESESNEGEQEESEELETGESEQTEEGETKQSGKGEPEESDNFDDSDDDSDDDSEDDSENGSEEQKTEQPESDNDGDSSQSDEKPDSDPNNSGEQEQPENKDSDGEESDESSEDGDAEEDFEDESEEDSRDSEGDGSDEEDSDGDDLEPIDQKIKQALDDATKELSDMMGGIRAGTDESLFGARDEGNLAELYTALGRNAALSKIIEMIGRMQINQQFLNGITYSETTVPVAITQGNDVRNALPQDLGLLLGSNEEFMIFADKFNNKQILQRQFEAEQNAGKGPMILCLDESGSMYGPKLEWAQSISVAMYFQALKERRQFALIKFATNSKALDLPKSTSRMDIDFMKSMVAEGYLGGGTNFQPAWNDAMSIIDKDRTWKYADVVFITDGFGHFDATQWAQDKEQRKIRLVSFFLDERGQFRGQLNYSYQLKQLIELSDAFSLIDDLTQSGEKAAFNIIRNKDAKGFIELQTAKRTRGRGR